MKGKKSYSIFGANSCNWFGIIETNYTTALQQHVSFFDRNKDGIIYPRETFLGFRAIGFNMPISFLAALFINIGLSYKSLDSWIPSLRFPIYIKNIRFDRHGNDSGVYDEEGRFVPQKFEDLFRTFAKTYPDRLSWEEIKEMRSTFRRDSSLNGRIASLLEWTFVYDLLKDDQGYIHKDDIRRVYDGNIFYYLEEKNSKNISSHS